jgi:hypothetical protein
MADLLDDIVGAATALTDGLRSADVVRGDDPVIVRLTSDAGEKIETMIYASNRLPFSDRYGQRPRIADGAIASLMIAGVEFQWPRKRYAQPSGGSTHYPHREIMGPDGIIRRDPGSND